MSTAAALAAPLAETALARWLQSGWVYPMVESAHLLSIALLVGSIAVVDLRLMGLLRHQAAAALMRSALPVSLAGFCGAVATGSACRRRAPCLRVRAPRHPVAAATSSHSAICQPCTDSG